MRNYMCDVRCLCGRFIFLMQSIYQSACMGSLAEMLTKFVIVYFEQNDHSLLK